MSVRTRATMPIRLHSTLNMREHWSARAKRVKAQRAAVAYTGVGRGCRLPCVVKITRIGKRKLDGDNLQGACKAVRDQVAVHLMVDDADPRVTWEYAQEKGDYAVRIEVKS